MLAGKVRLKNFMIGVGTLVGIGCGAAVFLMAGAMDSCTRTVQEPHPLVAADPTPAPLPSPPPQGTSASGRAVDSVALAYKGRDLGTDKKKDVTAGKPFKVNVYQDAGHTTANRVKIDLDRDEKWDEKWTFEDDKVTREVAPADDEVYSRTYHWSGQAWVAEGAGADEAEPAPPDEVPTAAKGRPVDEAALGYRGKNIGSEKLKDVTKGKPYKINVYQDAGHTTVNRLKIDLNRNDKWDEKWTFDGDDVLREVAPLDDEAYTEKSAWDGSSWVAR